MSTRYWVGGNGGAANVAQIAQATFATYDVSTTRTITIGTGAYAVAVSLADSGGNLTAALTALASSLNGSAHPYFFAVTWSSDATHIIGTSKTAGVPFSFLGSVSGGTGTVSSAYAVTTADKGPNSWSVAANWSAATVPVNGDTVIFDGTSDYALCQSLGTGIYCNLRIDQPATISIGMPRSFTTDVACATVSSPEVPEYRQQYLKMTAAADAITCDIGREFGQNTTSGSGRIKIDFENSTATVQVFNCAALATDDGLCPIQFNFGTNPYSTLFIRKGMVNIGAQTETCTLLECDVADTSSFSRVIMGTGVSCAIFKANGGNHVIQTVASLAITNNGATIDVEGNTTIATNTITKGTTNINGAVTVTTSTVKSFGTINCMKSGRAVTLTNLALSRNATFVSGPNVTHTNAVTFPDGPYQVTPQ